MNYWGDQSCKHKTKEEEEDNMRIWHCGVGELRDLDQNLTIVLNYGLGGEWDQNIRH